MKLLKLALLLCLLSNAQLKARSGPDAVSFTVTAYCPCAKCCGRANQPAANGKKPVEGITVAGPRRYPLGTRIYIEGIGERVIQDRLAKRYDDRIDIFMISHDAARKFGIKQLPVTILNASE